jgi:hypothetical protein
MKTGISYKRGKKKPPSYDYAPLDADDKRICAISDRSIDVDKGISQIVLLPPCRQEIHPRCKRFVTRRVV